MWPLWRSSLPLGERVKDESGGCLLGSCLRVVLGEVVVSEGVLNLFQNFFLV